MCNKTTKILTPVILFSLIASSQPVFAFEGIIATSDSIEIEGDVQCTDIKGDVSSDGGFFGGTRIRLSVTSNSRCERPRNQTAEPCPDINDIFSGYRNIPERIPVKKDDEIVGAISEVEPHSGVYMTARHVFQLLSAAEIEEQFSQFNLFEIRSKKPTQKIYDIVLLIDKSRKVSSSDGWLIKLRALEATPGESWISLQTGHDGELSSEQTSCGQIAKSIKIPGFDKHDYSLDNIGNRNYTSPSSSGSLVWTYNREFQTTKLIGMINCQQYPLQSELASTSHQDPTTHVINFKRVFNDANIKGITSSDAANKFIDMETFQNCLPIGGRGAGAD